MDFFKKHEKTIIWIVVLVIIPVFGIGGLLTTRSAFFSGRTLGKLGNHSVSLDDMRKFAQKHNFPTNIPMQVFSEQYMPFYAEFEKAKRSGFMVSDAEVREAIRTSPLFQGDDGRFNAGQFNDFLEKRRMSESLLFEAVREQALLKKTNPAMLYMLRNVIPVFVTPESYTGIMQQPVPVTNDEILLKYKEENDTYKIKYIRVPVEDLPKEKTPTYDEIKDIYNQARARIDSDPENNADDGFFTDHPIREDIEKQWIVVRYLGISKSEIAKLIEVDETIVLDYYEKNKESRYRIKEEDKEEGKEENAAEDKKETEKKEETDKKDETPRYKPLDDTLKKSIESVLKDREVDRIAKLIKDNIEDAKAEAENKGEPVTLDDLGRGRYLNDIESEAGYTRKDGKAVFTGLSDPVDIPRNRWSSIWIDVREDKRPLSKFGALSPGYSRGRTDWNRAYDALTQPDPDISTDLLEMSGGYCMFIPVWWPNKETQGTGKPDLSYYVPFPEKSLVGVKDEAEEKEKKKEDTKEADNRSVLDIKIQLTKENAGIKLYTNIKNQLIDKKKDILAREKADELNKTLTPENFDEAGKKNGFAVETEGPKTLNQGGEKFKACYYLAPGKEKSAVFSDSDRKGRFFGIAMLLERKSADEKTIPAEKIDSLKKQIRQEKEREIANLADSVNKLDWKPKQ